MKKIVSLALAALVVSAGMMHAVNLGKQVINAGATREIPPAVPATMEPLTAPLVVAAPALMAAPLTATLLAGVINAADLSTDGVRAAVKKQVADAFAALGSDLAVISKWCDDLVGNGSTTGVSTANGKQLIADILVAQPVLAAALRKFGTMPSEDVNYTSALAAFKAALSALSAKNGIPIIDYRSDLDHAFKQILEALTVVLTNADHAITIPVASVWDELGKLLAFHP